MSAPQSAENGRYICEVCGTRYEAPGDCPKDPGEPLLDLHDEDVYLMLQDFDAQRWRKRLGVTTVVGFVLTSPILLIIPLLFSMAASEGYTSGPRRGLSKAIVGVVAGWCMAAVALGGVLIAFVPPRKVAPPKDTIMLSA